MALVLPSLWGGRRLDDFILESILSRAPLAAGLAASRLDLFNFLDGDPARTRRLIDLGLVPWWTLEEVRVSFWRPLSALSHWLDHRLWPDLPSLMHAQSILWYGGLVLAVAILYRRLMGPNWAAGLAALLYAVDSAHGFPAGWLANRNALLGALFGTLALWAHDRCRRDGWRAGAGLGPALLLAALLSAEAAVATIGYLVAHAVFLDRESRRARVVALVPYALIALGWALVYRRLGHGTWGAAPFYVSPGEPTQFARALVEHGPFLLFAQWGVPLDLALSFVGSPRVLWIAALLFLALLGVLLLPLLRRSEVARFWALGHVLAVVPACSTLPHERHLLLIGVGAMGLLAQFLAGLVDRGSWLPSAAAWRISAVALSVPLVAAHAVLAPLRLPVAAQGFVEFDRILRAGAESLPLDPRLEQQDLVIVNAPDAGVASFVHFYRASNGQPLPRRSRRLASSLAPVELSRPDAQTLVVRQAGGFFPQPYDRVFRGRSHPMTEGQRVPLTGLTVAVTQVTGDGRPLEAVFRFAVRLEDPSLRWVAWRHQDGSGRYVPFTPPGIGERIRLP